MLELANARERERQSLAELRSELAHLRARYDDGAISPGIFKVVRDLEIDLAWMIRATTFGDLFGHLS
jgi:hypothetical protein